MQVLPAADCVTIVTAPTPHQSACPLCGGLSGRVHSHYTRTLADLPWQGRVVAVQVRARRFRCTSTGCPGRIFTERLPEVAPPRARRTMRLGDVQRHIGLGLGGAPGSRLAARLAMPVGGDTLLRMIRSSSVTASPPPRVIGVDDWAWRRGQRYGTIICDLERRRVVDLLPDRGAGTLACWLKRYGGEVAVVSRDRSGAYADGIRAGAPETVQVTDRWHLLVNCSDALRQLLDRHQRQLRQAAHACTVGGRVPTPAPPRARTSTQADRRKAARRERRQARYDAVAELHRAGVPIRRIARQLGMARNAVRRWLRAGEAAPYRRAPGRSVLDRHLGYVQRRWAEGCRNAAELWRGLREECGFEGGYDVVRRWAAPGPSDGPAWLRRRLIAGHQGRTGGVVAALEQRSRGGSNQPAQDHQTPDVWSRQVRLVARPCPPRRVTETTGRSHLILPDCTRSADEPTFRAD